MVKPSRTLAVGGVVLLVGLAAVLFVMQQPVVVPVTPPLPDTATTTEAILADVPRPAVLDLPSLGSAFCNAITNKSHREVFNEGIGTSVYWEQQSNPGTCSVAVSESVRSLISFELDPEPPTDLVITSVKFYSPSGKLIQSLPLAYPGSYVANDVNLRDDINFDGYKDLLLRVWSPRAAAFSYYLYDPKSGRFEEEETLRNIFSPTFDATARTITTMPDIPNYYTTATGEQEYYTPEEQTTLYQFIDGRWVEQAR